MGGRQSKRSVDISGTPKKGELENGGTVEERLERIEEGDVAPKVALNGSTPHAEEPAKTPATEEAVPLVNGDHKGDAEGDKLSPEETTEDKQGEEKKEEDESTEQKVEETPTQTPDKTDKKKKEKQKKKWSFRSISFSRKDKSKPSTKEEVKNGDVTIEEPVPEVAETETTAVEAPKTEAVPVQEEGKKEESPAEPAAEEGKKEEPAAESTETAAEEETPAPAEETATEESPAEESAAVEEAPAEESKAPEESAAEPEAESEAAPTEEASESAPAPSEEESAEPEKEAECESAPASPSSESGSEPEFCEDSPACEPVEACPVAAEVVTAVIEEKLEEIPPPLPASPPPTEAPPPTPVAPTPAPAPVEISPALSQLSNDAETQENDVAGGGGESMAELPPGDVEPVLDVDEKEIETKLVNGVHEETHQITGDDNAKVQFMKSIYSENTESNLISTNTEIISVTTTTGELQKAEE